jgi:hypothetical protein
MERLMKPIWISGILFLCATALVFVWLHRTSPKDSAFNSRTAATQATELRLDRTPGSNDPPASNSILSTLKTEPRKALPPSKVGVLSAGEEAELLGVYRSITNPLQRFGVMTALACGGGDASFQAFRHSLEEEFRGKNFSSQEESAVLLTARSIGLLAPRSAAAWEYVKSGCFPQKWMQIEKWKGTRRNADFYLADYCIQGVGLAGTPEARAFLVQLTEQLERKDAMELYSAVLSAAADLDICESKGRDGFLDHVFMQHEHYDLYERWKSSEKAKPWLEWRDKVQAGK